MTRTTTTVEPIAPPINQTTSVAMTVPTIGRSGRAPVAHVLLGLLAAGGLVAGLGLSSGQALACRPIDPPMKHHAAPAPHVTVSRETPTGAFASGGPVVRSRAIRRAPSQGGDPQP